MDGLYHMLPMIILVTCLSESVATVDYYGYRMIGIPMAGIDLNRIDDVFEKIDAIDSGLTSREIHFMIPPRIKDNILSNYFTNFTVIHEDMGKVFANEKSKKSSSKSYDLTWDDYYDVDTIYKYLEDMHEKHPTITELIEGGRSYEGRKILGLRINTSNKPTGVIESGIHAREWITPAVTTYFIEKLLMSDDPSIAQMRDAVDWHIFPTVNPDGYHYSHTTDRMWRKTRSPSPGTDCYGADPNRNWDHHWGKHSSSKNPCNNQTYCGSAIFSEVETLTFSEYLSQIKDIRLYIGVHSDAQMVLIPYSDSPLPQENYYDLVEIGKASIECGRQVNGILYKGPDTAAKLLYAVSGGSMDWVKEKLGADLVFTFEMRGDDFHWPKDNIPEQGEEFFHMIRGLINKSTLLGYWD